MRKYGVKDTNSKVGSKLNNKKSAKIFPLTRKSDLLASLHVRGDSILKTNFWAMNILIKKKNNVTKYKFIELFHYSMLKLT